MSFLINLTGLGALANACKTPASARYRFDDEPQASLNLEAPRDCDGVGASAVGIGMPPRARMGEGQHQGVAS
jgi:hypothetical protein